MDFAKKIENIKIWNIEIELQSKKNTHTFITFLTGFDLFVVYFN